METTTAPLTHCPTCGVKLERPELSMCAYCASPLRVGQPEVRSDETQKRLVKVRAHADFAAAQAWLPLDPAFETRARAHSRRAGWLFAIGVVVGGLSFALGEHASIVALGCAGALAAAALASLGLASSVRNEHRRTPMLKRAAYVLDRRSQTSDRGGLGSTVYFFKIRFEDGAEGEFSHIGRGSMYEPPAVGAAGVAYTRGARMLEFRRI